MPRGRSSRLYLCNNDLGEQMRGSAMRVGLLVPTSFAFGNPASGAARLARGTAEALDALGSFDAMRLSPWEHASQRGLSLLHAFGGPEGFERIGRNHLGVPVILTPIHDSLQSAWRYRLAASLGDIHTRFSTTAATKRRLYRSVDRVLALSRDEADRIVSSCGVIPSRVVVVNAAIGPPSHVSESRRESLRDTHQLPDEFVLALCDYGAKRKNVVRLARACQNAALPLVLAGNASDTRDATEIRDLASRGGIQVLPPMPEEDVPTLMSMARVYGQPSLEEGAGLAAMEASTYGCSVVASRVGGVEEHLGPGATYVDPLSVDSITGGLLAAWSCSGANPVADFVLGNRRWENTVRQLEAVYHSVT